MMMQFLVQVRDKNRLEFLKQYGYIVHIAKLTGLVVLEADEKIECQLKNHPDVINIRMADTFQIAR
ncbi:hypothetical protein [Brevibacillus panacihumi]|uniref:Uncharacterized protein n=1 Tax=Brevibacillus panacihumi TaxID=497735 RepID=A0A3M8CTT2_9BACL|nr:hypothetical protein [Brevibacillus panacihumi]RNB79038.1 hypothetical protein EDM58_10170 [Brevibacillus panacihumi]